MLEEKGDRNVGTSKSEEVESFDSNSSTSIVLSDATAKWTNDQTVNSLENINLTVRPNRLVAIIGQVGAGKVLKMIDIILNSFAVDIRENVFITEFVDANDFTRAATFRWKYFRERRSLFCITRTVVVRWNHSTKYSIRFANR